MCDVWHINKTTGNEWRTRFENQLELNEYLQAQSQNLTQKIEEAREAIKDSKLPNLILKLHIDTSPNLLF